MYASCIVIRLLLTVLAWLLFNTTLRLWANCSHLCRHEWTYLLLRPTTEHQKSDWKHFCLEATTDHAASWLCLFICDLIRNTFTYLLIIPCASPMLAKRQWCSSCNREDDCESGFALVNASQTWRSQMSTLPSYKSPHPGGEWHAHFTVAIVVC